jgi:hypothetical protein
VRPDFFALEFAFLVGLEYRASAERRLVRQIDSDLWNKPPGCIERAAGDLADCIQPDLKTYQRRSACTRLRSKLSLPFNYDEPQNRTTMRASFSFHLDIVEAVGVPEGV